MRELISFLIFFLAVIGNSHAQMKLSDNPFAHTFSIVARDSVTGDMGVAVQSHWYSVGTIVSWGEAGVGVIATQSFVNPAFGTEGLRLLKSGMSARQVVDKLISEDNGRDYRQLAVLDAKGNAAAYSGKNCIAEAGQITGKNFSVQANMMLNNKVPAAMSEAFENTQGPLAERLVAALEAAQAVGGDIRGKQSAALLVVKAKSTGKIWEDRTVDIRVDDNDEPIKEIARILKVHRAYQHMNKGDLALEHGDMEGALEEYSSAEKMFPDNLEMKFWHAVTLANNGRLEDSLPIFKTVFEQNSNWKILFSRLPKAGLLNVSEKSLNLILTD